MVIGVKEQQIPRKYIFTGLDWKSMRFLIPKIKI